jgi:hypothetical protein
LQLAELRVRKFLDDLLREKSGLTKNHDGEYTSMADADASYRRATRIRIPLFGRSVIDACGVTSRETSSNFQRCAIVVTISTASIHAKPSPMQMRGPAPNGKYEVAKGILLLGPGGIDMSREW